MLLGGKLFRLAHPGHTFYHNYHIKNVRTAAAVAEVRSTNVPAADAKWGCCAYYAMKQNNAPGQARGERVGPLPCGPREGCVDTL